MDIRNIILLLYCFIFFWACSGKECKDNRNFEFELSINYTPVVDTFQLGDTLHIKSSFYDELIDVLTYESIKVEDFNFFTAIAFNKLDDDQFLPTDLSSTQILNIDVEYQIIHYSDGGVGILIEKHNFDDGEYYFSLDLVLTEIGKFHVSNSSGLGVSNATSQQRFEGQCPNDMVYAIYKLNNGDAYENNYSLIESVIPLDNLTAVNYNRGGGFAFYVEE